MAKAKSSSSKTGKDEESKVAEPTASNEKAKEATPQNNVIWSSEKNEDGTPKYGEPPSSIRVSMDVIELPDAKTQLKGFYHPQAATLIRVKNGYKPIVPKG